MATVYSVKKQVNSEKKVERPLQEMVSILLTVYVWKVSMVTDSMWNDGDRKHIVA